MGLITLFDTIHKPYSVAVPGILFRGVIKKFKLKKKIDKKRTWIYRVIDKKKNMNFYNFLLQVFNFELLHDSSLWVFITNMGSVGGKRPRGPYQYLH